jgi:heterotetrameric sarcosine oxidase delta subunit
MFLIKCPNCGPRSATEFRYGGEVHSRPEGSADQELADYLYVRKNALGVQTEWWYHRMGCRRWFMARRHTMTNEVLAMFWPEETGEREGGAGD